MEIKMRKPGELKDYENNPRKNKKAINAVAKSIQQFGFKNPVIIDIDDNIIAGHTRKAAAIKLKLKEIPTILADDLTEDEIKAFRIVDNRTAEMSEWDDAKLNAELQELFDIEFDMDEYFDVAEKEKILESTEQAFQAEEKLKEIEEAEDDIEIQYGDMYQLGNHKLLCGDSFKMDDIKKIIGYEPIDMIFTDPPYNIQSGGGSGCFKDVHRERLDGLVDFDVESIKHFLNLKINSFYICTSKDLIRDYLNLFKNFSYNVLVWCKSNPTPLTNNNYLPDMEYILFFHNKDRIWNNSLKPTSIYKKFYLSKKDEGREGIEGQHPTIKPLELIIPNIYISSEENGYILDPFGGSGSTMIAAEQTKRKCLMIEKEPKYCQVIIDRWEDFTGNKSKLGD